MNSEVIRNFQYEKESSNQIHVYDVHKFTCVNCGKIVLEKQLKKSAELNEIRFENILSLHLMGCEKYHQNAI